MLDAIEEKLCQVVNVCFLALDDLGRVSWLDGTCGVEMICGPAEPKGRSNGNVGTEEHWRHSFACECLFHDGSEHFLFFV